MSHSRISKLKLTEVLLRNPPGCNFALAAYIRANTHHARREYGRAIQYARIALQKSRDLRLDELATNSLELLGRLEIVQSHFESACILFRQTLQGLDAKGEGHSRAAALCSDHLGYCHIALDRVALGLPFVYRAVQILGKSGNRQDLPYPFLDLCLGHLKKNQLEEAEKWGFRALALGKEFGEDPVIKNSHYLLSEIYFEMGRDAEAEEQHQSLLSYYPDIPELKQYLRQISLMKMINLRA